MMNIGFNPTVNGQNHSIEIYYFDFNQDLYHQEIKVTVLHRLRDEQKFNTISLLKEQLGKDKIDANQFLLKLKF